MSFEKDVIEIRNTINGFETLLTEALLTDGADQKQHYIEQILEGLMGTEEFEKKKKRLKWIEGTAP